MKMGAVSLVEVAMRRGAIFAIAMALAGDPQSAHATDYFWLDGDGSFDDDSKWQDYADPNHHETPGSGDSAIFYSSANYSVYLNQDQSVNYSAVGGASGSIYFSGYFGSLAANDFRVGDYDGGGTPAFADNKTLFLYGDPNQPRDHLQSTYLTVGGGGTGTLWLYATGRYKSLPGGTVTVGSAASGNGTVIVADPNSVLDADGNDVTVGKFGKGSMALFNGGHVTGVDVLSIGAETGNTNDNSVYVNNAGSLLEATTMYVGDRGKGTLGVFAGGKVQLIDGGLGLSVGRVSGAQGFLDVTNPGTRLDASGTAQAVYVGDFGGGTMYVHDSARADVNYLYIGAQTGSQGYAYVYDPNSVLAVNQLNVGHGGTGALEVTNGGKVEVGVLLDVGFQNAGVGTVTVSGTNSTLDALGTDIRVGINGTGSLTVSAGGRIVNAGGVGVGSGANAHNNSMLVTGSGSEVRMGALSVGFNNTVGDSTVTVSGNARMTVAGAITLGPRGTLDTTEGAIDVTDSTPTAATGTLRVGLNGLLNGAGTVKGDVFSENSGLVSLHPTGTMTIDGDFTQTTGQLSLFLTGANPGQYSHLNILGQATFGGLLNVSKLFSFDPGAGDTFDLLSFAAPSGTIFSTVQLPPLASGLTWDTSQLYSLGKIRVLGPGFYEADFDDDDDVDADDLARWEAGYGTASGAERIDGDADGNEIVDGRDFLIWQRQFGLGVPLQAAATAVPEPAGALLLFAAVIFRFRMTRH